jgi:RNA polymerase sigma-70 factor (ECF subfamily)
MDRYAQGDDGALDDLYRLGAPRVRSFLVRLAGSLALADDLTQDVFLRVCSARGSFVAGAPALPWVLAIARNAFRDHTRREQVRRNHRTDSMQLLREEGTSGARVGATEDRALIARQTLGLVQRTLMSLPVLQREAFVLVRFEGLSLADAAQVLGATQAAVKIRVFRAYTAVRGALDAEGEQETHSSSARASTP